MIFVEGLEHPEAPLLMDDGSWLVAEMGMGDGGLTRVDTRGRKQRWLTTGRPNGLLKAEEGGVWVAESWQPSLVKILSNGKKHSVINGCGDQPFLWPNDLVYGPDGAIYLTDSGIKVEALLTENGVNERAWQGAMNGCLYRIDPDSMVVSCLDQGFRFTNGIAFGPDGKLYINETVTGHIYRYDYDKQVVAGSRERFASVIDPRHPVSTGVVGPDGMTFDSESNLYVALFGQSHIAVVSPSGDIDRSIVTKGSCPTNVAFGPAGSRTLYITEFQQGRIETVTVPHGGFSGFDYRS